MGEEKNSLDEKKTEISISRKENFSCICFYIEMQKTRQILSDLSGSKRLISSPVPAEDNDCRSSPVKDLVRRKPRQPASRRRLYSDRPDKDILLL